MTKSIFIFALCAFISHSAVAQKAGRNSVAYAKNVRNNSYTAVQNREDSIKSASARQRQKQSESLKSLEPYNIGTSFNQTTHIIFPQKVKYVDLGSPDIIADKAGEVENVVRIKAAKQNFGSPTTLTVITVDGKYYSFYVTYTENPELNLVLSESQPATSYIPNNVSKVKESKMFFENAEIGEGEMSQYANWIINRKRTVKHVGEVAYQFRFSLRGIYIKDNVMFLKAGFKNESFINYEVDMIRFVVRDKVVAKSTPVQEVEQQPIYTFTKPDYNYPNHKGIMVKGQSFIEVVYAFPKFTIPNDKVLEMQVTEKNGGRNLKFTVENDDIIRAKVPEKLIPGTN